jgi:polar amino acid transport system permease protein
MDLIADFFRDLASTTPRWNFIWMYEPVQQGKILSGIWVTIKLSIACLLFSVVIGVAGAFAQGRSNRLLRAIVQGYIQFFRNTPPYVQLLFFYFALGQFTPTYSPDGWLELPIISNVGWPLYRCRYLLVHLMSKSFALESKQYPKAPRKPPIPWGSTDRRSISIL